MAVTSLPDPPPADASPSRFQEYLSKIAQLVAGGLIGAGFAKALVNSNVPAPYKLKYGPMTKMAPTPGLRRFRRDIPYYLDVPTRLTGKGKYGVRSLMRDVTAGLGAAGGSALAGPVGGAVGGGIGMELGDRIFGSGDYTVGMNSITTKGVVLNEGADLPSFGAGGFGTRIQHKEFIRDVVAPGVPATFTNIGNAINPGNADLFPWLSQIAANYQQYEFKGLVFWFKTTTSDYAAGGALGTLIMATNYDVLETDFASKVIMENSQYAVSAKPSRSQVHCIECDPKTQVTKLHYVRDTSSSAVASQDARFYDVGKFQIATSGLSSAAGTVIGELWCSYDVVLHKPEIVTSSSTGQKIAAGGTVNNGQIFGLVPVYTGTTIATASLSTLTFARPGEYLLVLTITGTGVVSSTDTGTATVTEIWQEYAGAGTSGEIMYRVQVTAPGQTLALDHSGSTTITNSILRIANYKYSNA